MPLGADDNARSLGDRHMAAGEWEEALGAYLALPGESRPADVVVRIARCHAALGRFDEPARWLARVSDDVTDFGSWLAALRVLDDLRAAGPLAFRRLRLAVLGTSTLHQLASFLRLAVLRLGIDLETYVPPFGQLEQEILAPDSGLHRFAPDVVLIATRDGDLALPELSDDPETTITEEVGRWTSIAQRAATTTGARVIFHKFAIGEDGALGHLAGQLPGSRLSMARAVNAALSAETLGPGILAVDCDALAARFGKQRWFSDRYWAISKQAVALDALPLLAVHTAAVLGASLGLSKKCLVLDLDGTLWGGSIGEVGVDGIRLGGDGGEGFLSFQEQVLALGRRGVILAVCSKNDEEVARRAFTDHPDMRIGLDDIACFVANWKPKTDNIRTIAETLDIGLDAMVFVDDNPAERELIRTALPEVDVVTLPEHPSGYRGALAAYPWFEAASYTAEDARRTSLYRARAEAARLRESAGTLEDFYRSLGMVADLQPFDEMTLERVAQLVGKTNQFNLTTRRHPINTLRAFAADDDAIHFSLRLRDRLADHGLVGVLIAFRRGDVADIDTWLMSCRVIGRTAERVMAAELCRRAEDLGCTRLRGTFQRTERNGLVSDLFPELGFTMVAEDEGATIWEYDLARSGPIASPFIEKEATVVR